MGTSSSYGGPTGNNPLLPDWAQPDNVNPMPNDADPSEGEDAGEVNDESTNDSNEEPATTDPATQSQPTPVNFRGAKSSMTRFVSGGGGSSGVGRSRTRARVGQPNRPLSS